MAAWVNNSERTDIYYIFLYVYLRLAQILSKKHIEGIWLDFSRREIKTGAERWSRKKPIAEGYYQGSDAVNYVRECWILFISFSFPLGKAIE